MVLDQSLGLLVKGVVIIAYLNEMHCHYFIWPCAYGLQCFDAVGWAAGRASGL